MKITPIAWTVFHAAAGHARTGFVCEDVLNKSGQALAEFAGRGCYKSFNKPNPATASNRDYLANILELRHLSVLEHATITWYIQDVSRSLTHELVRHRVGTAISQESQRYASPSVGWVIPPAVQDEPSRTFLEGVGKTFGEVYQTLLANLNQILGDTPGLSRREAVKGAREAARAVLPNMTPTSLTWTANYRALRHIIDLRATEHADREIRAFAVALLRDCQVIAPNVFGDYRIIEHVDGTEVAISRFQPPPPPGESEWLDSIG